MIKSYYSYWSDLLLSFPFLPKKKANYSLPSLISLF